MTEASASDNAADLARKIGARIRALPTRRTEAVRAVRREFSKLLAGRERQFVIDVALRVMNEPGIDRFVSYELVKHHRGALASLRERHLKQFGRDLEGWVEVDCFACYLAGPAWRELQIPDGLIHNWARSKDRWWRRAALVSTVPLNSKAQGGSGDPRRTLEVCGMLVSDRDDMVVKALSWALRELSKREPKKVREFLSQHREVVAARVRREVGNKLSTGLKNPRRTSGAARRGTR